MFFLQIPAADDIAEDVSTTFEGLKSEWVKFLHMFLDSPIEGLKFLGTHALGIAIKIAIVLFLFWAGRWLIGRLVKLIGAIFDKRGGDSSVRIFLDYLVSIFLWIVLIIAAIGIMGWEMSGLVAIFAAAAFAIGMALSGTLSNFAGGIIILLVKPFRIGDYIISQDFEGTVRSIELFNTVITTVDNKTVIMPNGALSTSIVENVTRQRVRMVEWKVGISYGGDFGEAEKVIRKILADDGRVMSEPAGTVVIGELGASAVILLIRAWVASDDCLPVYWNVNRQLYEQLPSHAIEFSWQTDVRLWDNDKS